MINKNSFILLVLILLLLTHGSSMAERYNWKAWSLRDEPTQHNSPDRACQDYYNTLIKDDEIPVTGYHPVTPHEFYYWKWLCKIDYIPIEIAEEDGGPDPGALISGIHLFGDACGPAEFFNKQTGMCEAERLDEVCSSSFVGNPINFITGQKIQRERDFPALNIPNKAFGIEFSRTYNSKNGAWIHNYATRMIFNNDTIAIINVDGKTSIFNKSENTYKSENQRIESLTKKLANWIYRSPVNHYYIFNEQGELTEIQKFGVVQKITHINDAITVSDSYGTKISFREDTKNQPLSFTFQNLQINYDYDEVQQLISVTKTYPDKFYKKTYSYNDLQDRKLLTSMTDERGIIYASWSYDPQGRAISSEHANGVEKTHISYNVDGSTTVTNALGKKTTYTFDFIQGNKRILSIYGEPSPNCLSSNSTFSYDKNGLRSSKKDNEGNITTYIYNSRGQEISRTEASETSYARTITTEWHPTLPLPVRIKEPNRLIQYTYDAQGRQLSQTIISPESEGSDDERTGI
ncbi:DUF6531 domain-containing protein [Pseudomonas sp. PD9R]|uniref:DUF6531 domain-containing protein n=1 Tax=Pseudomonas sp. PD9R TaxID=2853534 RepID=UPI001C43CA85|nr:DUF6531 domain-containing protein [Pseudomonas sp. PD9R]MBV6825363.1 RHS repeat protein [Pseudomonas sp. PD9R]